MKKELIFLGPPACGKGTQTAKLSEYLNFPHVDTGSLLTVELVTRIIKNRLSQDDCKNGYILDGFPRSVEQADELTKMNADIDKDIQAEFKAIYFDIDTSILVERIVNRRSCPKCGEIYNLAFKAPQKDGICDKCGAELTQRKDDTREVAQSRFDTYFKETAPLIDYYKNKGVLKTIDANGEISEVWERLLKVVND